MMIIGVNGAGWKSRLISHTSVTLRYALNVTAGGITASDAKERGRRFIVMNIPTEYQQGHSDGVRESERGFAEILYAICMTYGVGEKHRIEVPHIFVEGVHTNKLNWGQDPLGQVYFYEVRDESA